MELYLLFNKTVDSVDCFLKKMINDINKYVDESEYEKLYGSCEAIVENEESIKKGGTMIEELVAMIKPKMSPVNGGTLFIYQIDLQVLISALMLFAKAIVRKDLSEDIYVMINRLNGAYESYIESKNKVVLI
ncbi:hypothetical protein [Clostridium perfringens]|uniref:hypothetical protein n=1 Tax=Clostridium perfringens TaxID=1502 RepID=UPI002245ADC0|nr:hypothetical protein [Clostridium perfringens]MCX0367874.1 hypothetical protein [Clostridium perfringens]